MRLWDLYLTGSAAILITVIAVCSLLFLFDILEKNEDYTLNEWPVYAFMFVGFGSFCYLMRDLLF